MFLDCSDFDFIPPLEQNWQSIRREALSIPDDLFEPWIQRDMYGTGWHLAELNFYGKPVPAMLERCPTTADSLERIPGLVMATFSRMAPGTHIEPHVGWGDRVYRFHLGLVVPPDCAIKVGNETRPWQEGACLGFDDTEWHEAWNESSETRTVLMIDVMRPGLTGEPYDRRMLPDELVERLESMSRN